MMIFQKYDYICGINKYLKTIINQKIYLTRDKQTNEVTIFENRYACGAVFYKH